MIGYPPGYWALLDQTAAELRSLAQRILADADDNNFDSVSAEAEAVFLRFNEECGVSGDNAWSRAQGWAIGVVHGAREQLFQGLADFCHPDVAVMRAAHDALSDSIEEQP